MTITAPPIIDSLPTPPDPADRSTFNSRAYPWSLALGDMTSDVNAVANWMNDTAAEASAFATQASAFATQASAFATQASASATQASASATQAQNAAAAALNSPGTLVQFTQSHTIGTGTKEFAVGNAPYAVGQFVIVAKTSSPSNYMSGQVQGFTPTGMLVAIAYTEGAGTHSDWTLSLSPASVAGFIKNLPSGNISATTVQAAINELDAEKLSKTGDTMTGALNWATPVTMASAATTDIAAAASNRITVTGTTAITNLGTIPAGAVRTVTFAAALTLTHNSTSLILPGGANVTTAAGDVAEFESLGYGNWRCTAYLRASGKLSSGDVSATSLNGGQLAGMRNKIINGNFSIWQRGTSLTVSSVFSGNNLIADRFLSAADSTSSGSFTASQGKFTPGQVDVPFEPENFFRLTTSNLVNGTNGFTYLLQQRIEDVRTFAGQTVTVSFYARASANTTIAIALAQTYGTGGSTSTAPTAVTTRPLTTSWQKITATLTVPSIAGKTIGTSSYLALEIFGSLKGSTASAYGVSEINVLATGTYDLALLQLEYGSVATPFEHRPYSVELALCQRYFFALSNPGANTLYGPLSAAISSTRLICSAFTPPVPMRATPSIVQSGLLPYTTSFSAVNNITSAIVYAGSGNYFALDLTTSGLSTGSTYIISIGSGGFIHYNAEI